MQRLFHRLVELAADPPRPANLEHATARVVGNARLVLARARRLGDAVDVDIVEPGANRGFHVGEPDAAAKGNVAVDVNFGANLAIWDRLFGTWQPAEEAPTTLGQSTRLSLWRELLWPFGAETAQ